MGTLRMTGIVLTVATVALAGCGGSSMKKPETMQPPAAEPIVLTPESGNRVKTVRSDGEGGFDATFVVDGVEHQIGFSSDTLNEKGDFRITIDDLDWWLWPGNVELARGRFPDRKAGGFGHFDVYGWEVWDQTGTDREHLHRSYAVIGNPTVALPAGMATYKGPSYWTSYAPNVPHIPENGNRYMLDVELAVDFDTKSVQGEFKNMQWTRRRSEPGWRSYSTWEIGLRNGQITDTGIRADLVNTVGDSFSGSLTGQFFGPAAVEAGGVISGTYEFDSGPHEVEGWFGAEKE